ncbi:hypothetical protein HMPREF1013_04018 [Bacillus sp. 2_A_57_CT2]|jgi:hypothetical protein|nr:hypothetical protein HMPREF1013_04018 [Bacillus sp. 2_A_57_CT2]
MNTPGKSGPFYLSAHVFTENSLPFSLFAYNKENAANPAGRLAATMQTKDP